MRFIAATIAVLMLTTGLASAVEVKEKGAYMGAALGSTEYDQDNLVTGPNVDEKDGGFQLWGGYKFFKWFAVEGRASYLGEYTFGPVKSEYTALTGHAVFILPFGQSGWDIYGQLGLGLVNQNVSGLGASGDDTGSTGTAGLVVRWTPAPAWTISLGVDAWAWELETISGSKVDASVAMGRLGLQYNF